MKTGVVFVTVRSLRGSQEHQKQACKMNAGDEEENGNHGFL